LLSLSLSLSLFLHSKIASSPHLKNNSRYFARARPPARSLACERRREIHATAMETRVLRARFRGRVHTRRPGGVIVIARPAVARRSCTRTRTRARAAPLCPSPRPARILPRPAQILLRAGINLLPTFRSPLANAPRLRRKTGATLARDAGEGRTVRRVGEGG